LTNFINKIYPLLINKLTHKTGLAKLADQCSADTGSIYTIYENIGKLALSGKIISENTIVELENLSGGVYLLSIGENLKQTFKVIKE